MRAIKVQITATIHDYNSKPNTFKTAREANEAAVEEFGVQGVAIPIYVGRLKKGCYVLLQNDGDVVKYSSEGGRWLPISAEQQRSSEDILDADELEAGIEAAKQAPAFEVGKKYHTRTFSGRRNAGADITVVSITDKFVTFYDPATGGNTKRKIKIGDGYQHFTCDYRRYGSYITSWFEVGGARGGAK